MPKNILKIFSSVGFVIGIFAAIGFVAIVLLIIGVATNAKAT
ncbi:MAG: hypothetical protein WAM14_24510 [Candidatus Nitrosopolaris sp.]